MYFSSLDIVEKTSKLKPGEFFIVVGYDFQRGKEVKKFDFILDISSNTSNGKKVDSKFIYCKLIEENIVPFFTTKDVSTIVEILMNSGNLNYALQKNNYPFIFFNKMDEVLNCWIYPCHPLQHIEGEYYVHKNNK